MVNKRGFWRIVEATIAVMVVLAALIFLSTLRDRPVREDLSTEIPGLLDEVARNLSLREKIASGESETTIENDIELSFKMRLQNPSLNVSARVCNLTEQCFLQPYPDTDQEIFSSERILSGSIKNKTIQPKKIKIFLWRNLN